MNTIRAPGRTISVGEGCKKLNPHLFERTETHIETHAAAQPKRIRQNSKPLMNKLEQEWFDILSMSLCTSDLEATPPRAQSKTYLLANGVRYTPDVSCSRWPLSDLAGETTFRETCWEVKGKHSWDDAIVKLKVAAHEWPEVRWILVDKVDGKWREQEILP